MHKTEDPNSHDRSFNPVVFTAPTSVCVVSEKSNNAQIVNRKTDQIRDLVAQVMDDPVYTLRTFYEGSTIAETCSTKGDIANLETLDAD